MSLPFSPHGSQAPFDFIDGKEVLELLPISGVPEMGSLLVALAHEVVDQAVERSRSNPARMFYFNMLTRMDWLNESMQEAMQFAADLATFEYQSGRTTKLAHGITEAVRLGLTMLTSMQLVHFPELRSYVSAEVLRASQQNNENFHNLKQELLDMTSNMNNYGPLVPVGNINVPAHGPVYQNGQPMYPQMQGHYGPQPPMYPNQYPSHAPRAAYNPNQGRPGVFQQGGFQQPTFQGGPGGSNYGTSGNDTIGGRYTSGGNPDQPPPQRQPVRDVRAMMNQPQQQTNNRPSPLPTSYRVVEPSPEVLTDVTEVVVKVLTLEIEGGSELNRSKHTVKYFNGAVTAPLRDRMVNMGDKLPNITKFNLADGSTNQFVDPNPFVETSIAAAINEGRERLIIKQKHQTLDVPYRCAAFIMDPIMTPFDLKDYIEKIMACESFEDLIVVMRFMAVESSRVTDQPDYVHGLMTFLAQLDKRMSDVINDFLKGNLRMKTRIDSFCEDSSALADHLYKKGQVFSIAYREFETKVMQSMFMGMDKEIIDNVIDTYANGPELTFMFLPQSTSLTYLPFTAEELGYKVTAESAVIDRLTAPTLYALASSASKFKLTGGEHENMFDYIITSDDICYRIYHSALDSSQYLISKK